MPTSQIVVVIALAMTVCSNKPVHMHSPVRASFLHSQTESVKLVKETGQKALDIWLVVRVRLKLDAFALSTNAA